MKKFIVTFGQQYRKERHPTWGGIHPDGYITIDTDCLEKAIIIARTHFNGKYASVFCEADYTKESIRKLYPIGNLRTIDQNTLLSVWEQ